MGKRSRSRIRLAARQGRQLPPPQAAAVPGEPSGLARLAALAVRQREFQAAVDAQVDVLAAAGTPWPAIAAALGVTRQAARQGHRRRHMPPAAAAPAGSPRDGLPRPPRHAARARQIPA